MVKSQEPRELVAGDTWRWSRDDLSKQYSPADGWGLKYILLNASHKIEITATSDNGIHTVDESATSTASYHAGRYKWEAAVVKDTERYRVDQGSINVLPNFATNEILDTRTHARKVLEAIEAVIERRATKDQSSYSIDNRRLDRTPIKDLLVLRDRYKLEAEKEDQADQLKKTGGTGRFVYTRFRERSLY